MSNATQRIIENRKKAHLAYDRMDEIVASERKTMLIANFEATTAKKIEERNKKVNYF